MGCGWSNMGMGRRDFLRIAGAVAWAQALGGCRITRIGYENSCLRKNADECVAAGLYSGLACASTRGDMYVCGMRTLSEPRLPVTVDTLFDMASVGKTQTAALCALLYAEGKLDVDAPFTEYLPEHVLAKEDCRITVRDLATHSGGFDNTKPYMTTDAERMFAELFHKRPVRSRGERFEYACSNYVYLGLIVERLTGLDLDAAAKQMLWRPLGMKRTTWKPVVGDSDVAEYPSSTYSCINGMPAKRRIGERNDICAYLAPRPMGNGANFSTIGDMLLFADDMLERGCFPTAYYDLMFTPSFDRGGYRRSFGWDMTAEKSTFSIWTRTGFSSSAICHTGWTGCAMAIDPDNDFAGVVLGNRMGSKEATMGPRMHLLDVMRGSGSVCATSIVEGWRSGMFMHRQNENERMSPTTVLRIA